MRLSVSIRRARPSAAPFVTCMRSDAATSRSACDSSSWKDNSSGRTSGLIGTIETPSALSASQCRKKTGTIFEQQGNPRPASIAGGRVFGAQPIDLGLERAVFDLESFRRVGKSRACRRQQEWRVRPPCGRGGKGIGWRSIRSVEAHCGRRSCSCAAATARDGGRNPRAAPCCGGSFREYFKPKLSRRPSAIYADRPGETPGGACAGR